MDSLYGGVPGAPFILKRTYSSIDSMKTNNPKNAAQPEVYYGEYCIIECDINSYDNGKIFQRIHVPEGLSSDRLEGEFYQVGHIAGPSSGIPSIKVVSAEEILEKFNSIDKKTLIPENYSGNNETLKWSNGNEVEGTDGTVSSTSDFVYTWLNVERKDEENSNKFYKELYIAAQIPSPSFNFNVISKNGYDNNDIYNKVGSAIVTKNGYEYTVNAELPTGIQSPYYTDIHYIMGSNFPTSTAESEKYYLPEAFTIESDGSVEVDSTKIVINGGTPDAIDDDKPYLVATYHITEKTKNKDSNSDEYKKKTYNVKLGDINPTVPYYATTEWWEGTDEDNQSIDRWEDYKSGMVTYTKTTDSGTETSFYLYDNTVDDNNKVKGWTLIGELSLQLPDMEETFENQVSFGCWNAGGNNGV